MRLAPLWLAMPATASAVFLSVLSGMQRGGLPAERVAWIAISVLLTAAAHLLPAIWREARTSHRVVGTAIWAGCMVATCYGHAVFFLLAQQHAGEQRSMAVATTAGARDLGAIAEDRATAVAAQVARCSARCDAKHAVLQARIDALDVEAAEGRRREAADDQAVTHRDELRADPVTGRLAGMLGVPAARLDLLVGMLCALTLEGVACLCWALVLDHRAPAAVTEPITTVADAPPVVATGASSELDTARVAAEIAAGRLRCTVADIRRFLSCSQRRAMELRRELSSAGA